MILNRSPRIIKTADRTQRGIRNSLKMLLYQFGDFTRYRPLYDTAETFMIEAAKIAADRKVEHKEIEALIKKFEKGKKKDERMDLLTALLGIIEYKLDKGEFKELNRVTAGLHLKEIDDASLAVIASTLMRYFVTRMIEMSHEVGIVDAASWYRVWRFRRGMSDLFAKDLKRSQKNVGRFKSAEVGDISQRHTLYFFISEANRGLLAGGLRPSSARRYVEQLCMAFRTPYDSLDFVTRLGRQVFRGVYDIGEGKTKKQKKVKKTTFDFVRFLIGLNDFIEHPEALEDENVKRALQVFTAHMIYVFMIRFAYHFRRMGLTEKGPSYFDARDIRIALEGLYGLTRKQLRGFKGEPLKVEEKKLELEQEESSRRAGMGLSGKSAKKEQLAAVERGEK